MSGQNRRMITIRPFQPRDVEAVAALGARLSIGTAAWRDVENICAAVEGWVADAIDAAEHAPDRLMVAVDETEAVVGFVGVEKRRHWSGATDAYIGELVVAAEHENQGIGRALVDAALRWATVNGYERISVSTGAVNTRAVGLYERLGFEPEDVTLTRAVKSC